MTDKTKNHKSHGQSSDSQEEKDPCFAKVINGFDVIDKISSLQTKEQGRVLNEFVKIQNAKIL